MVVDTHTYEGIQESITNLIMGVIMIGFGWQDPIWSDWARLYIADKAGGQDPILNRPPWPLYANLIRKHKKYFESRVDDHARVRNGIMACAFFTYQAKFSDNQDESDKLIDQVLEDLMLLEETFKSEVYREEV